MLGTEEYCNTITLSLFSGFKGKHGKECECGGNYLTGANSLLYLSNGKLVFQN